MTLEDKAIELADRLRKLKARIHSVEMEVDTISKSPEFSFSYQYSPYQTMKVTGVEAGSEIYKDLQDVVLRHLQVRLDSLNAQKVSLVKELGDLAWETQL